MTTETEDATGSPESASRNSASMNSTADEGVAQDNAQTDGGGTNLASALEALEGQIERFHHRTERQEDIIRTMQERIVDLQGDQVLSLLKPALLRFAGLHAQAQTAAADAERRGEQAARDFAFFAVAVEEALGMVDLDSVDAVAGAPFDSTRHAATETVPTGDANLDLKIARVVRQGFTYPDAKRVTIPAQVTVHRFDEALAAEDQMPVSSTTAGYMTTQEQVADGKHADGTEGH